MSINEHVIRFGTGKVGDQSITITKKTPFDSLNAAVKNHLTMQSVAFEVNDSPSVTSYTLTGTPVTITVRELDRDNNITNLTFGCTRIGRPNPSKADRERYQQELEHGERIMLKVQRSLNLDGMLLEYIKQRSRRVPQTPTEYAIEGLIKYRDEQIETTGTSPLWTKSCKYIGIDTTTVIEHAKELHVKWKNPNYRPPYWQFNTGDWQE